MWYRPANEATVGPVDGATTGARTAVGGTTMGPVETGACTEGTLSLHAATPAIEATAAARTRAPRSERNVCEGSEATVVADRASWDMPWPVAFAASAIVRLRDGHASERAAALDGCAAMPATLDLVAP
jgi:hypothetical protein